MNELMKLVEQQPAQNNPNDDSIPYTSAYFGCCNRTVMTRADIAQPAYCPFCGRSLAASPPEAETRGMMAAAKLLCIRCRRDEPVSLGSNGETVFHGKNPCMAWRIRREKRVIAFSRTQEQRAIPPAIPPGLVAIGTGKRLAEK